MLRSIKENQYVKKSIELIRNCKLVSETVTPVPLILTKEFIEDHKIDIVVHAFLNEADMKTKRIF